MLKINNLGYRIAGKWILRDVSFEVSEKTFLSIVGPNGSGKTTLLRLLTGELKPTEGSILLFDKPVSDYSPLELACLRSHLAQNRHVEFPFTAFEIAFLGQTPHLENGRTLSAATDKTREALGMTRSEYLEDRVYSSLSGGEASRIDLTRVLNQEPRLLFLDEPTNHLDPRHQLEILSLCWSLSRVNKTVVTVMHDLNLASFFSDRLLLLDQGYIAALGTPAEVLTEDVLSEIYGITCDIMKHPSGCPWIVPSYFKTLTLKGKYHANHLTIV